MLSHKANKTGFFVQIPREKMLFTLKKGGFVPMDPFCIISQRKVVASIIKQGLYVCTPTRAKHLKESCTTSVSSAKSYFLNCIELTQPLMQCDHQCTSWPLSSGSSFDKGKVAQ
jgi:hypothetical protein